MINKITDLLKEAKAFKPKNKEDLEIFRVKFLSKKGVLNALFNSLKEVPKENKKAAGMAINALKNCVQEKISKNVFLFEKVKQVENIDTTMPVSLDALGSRHPISVIKERIISIFNNVGFSISSGPEIENDWYNFSALNLEEEHPARDMQDTFFIQTKPDVLLRTHTSSVQIRHMEKNSPPIRIISPGRVYRNEAVSSRAHCIFHQIEGLYIGEKISFADLKQIVFYFVEEMFGKNTKVRFRPSYFPFTEPSAEVDIYWGLKSESDYRITKGTGWLEILGCGMVDPNVLENCNIDSIKYSGFAFGMGIERIAMLKYGVKDLRLFFENDIRFLRQFSLL